VQLPVVELLLAAGAEVNKVGDYRDYGVTCFVHAIWAW